MKDPDYCAEQKTGRQFILNEHLNIAYSQFAEHPPFYHNDERTVGAMCPLSMHHVILGQKQLPRCIMKQVPMGNIPKTLR